MYSIVKVDESPFTPELEEKVTILSDSYTVIACVSSSAVVELLLIFVDVDSSTGFTVSPSLKVLHSIYVTSIFVSYALPLSITTIRNESSSSPDHKSANLSL